MSRPDIHPTSSSRHAICLSLSLFSRILHSYAFSIFLVQPGNPNTIQNLIPGWTTIVKLLKQVTNWQSPSRDPWSNCLINSREDDKGQSCYYSGRQKDNSKTICGRGGYRGPPTLCGTTPSFPSLLLRQGKKKDSSL